MVNINNRFAATYVNKQPQSDTQTIRNHNDQGKVGMTPTITNSILKQIFTAKSTSIHVYN